MLGFVLFVVVVCARVYVSVRVRVGMCACELFSVLFLLREQPLSTDCHVNILVVNTVIFIFVLFA